MTTNLFARLWNSWLILLTFCSSAGLLPAEQFGKFTYRLIPGGIEITDYPTTESGQVDVPTQIGSLPVTRIASSAFRDCTGLAGVTIPSGVDYIGSSAFENCSGLGNISIPSTVTFIGMRAFLGCAGLKGITLPSGITRVEAYTFVDCHGLTSIAIPSGVTSIGTGAFDDCRGLETISIPPSLTSIGQYAFRDCSNLTSILIPSGVALIQHSTFRGCTRLAVVNMEEGLVTIEAQAFYQCNSLSTINLPSTIATIGNDAFYGCGSLTEIALPAGLTHIGDYAFSVCTNLTSISLPPNLASLGSGAFTRCLGLQSILVPASVVSIGSGPFQGCSGLPLIAVDPTNPNYVAVDGVLFNSTQTELMQYPAGKVGAYAVPAGVKAIGGSAFSGTAGLTAVTIPTEVTSIGGGAFAYCTELPSIVIPSSVTSLGDSTFYGCTALISIVLPASMTSIGDWAFRDCSSLTSIVLPEGLPAVEYYMFYGCRNLTSVTIPSTVIRIEGNAFRECGKLAAIVLPTGVTSIDGAAFYGCDALTSVDLPDGLTNIGSYAFYNCYSLAGLTLPASLTTIGDNSFANCRGLKGIVFPAGVTTIPARAFSGCGGLTSVTLPSNLKTIGSAAFSSCYSLLSITIPATVTSIAADAFSYCNGLTSILVEPGNLHYASVDGALFNAAITELIQFPQAKTGSYTIPGTITEIPDQAFAGCGGLTAVALPTGLTTIGSAAFSDCYSLSSISIPAVVTHIGEQAFSGCSGLANVTIPASVTSIGIDAFAYCTGLTAITVDAANANYSSLDGVLFNKSRVTLIQYPGGKPGAYTLPDGVTSIDSSAFAYCSGLTTVTIPASVTSIGDGAFAGCTGLTEVILPAGLVNIGNYAFSGCAGLMSVLIPAAVTDIGWGVFDGCGTLAVIEVAPGNLNYVSVDGVLLDAAQTELIAVPQAKSGPYAIPATVTSIGWGAFQLCSGLSNIAIPASVTAIEDYAFEGCSGLTAITVDAGNAHFSSVAGVLFDLGRTKLLKYPEAKSGDYTIPDTVVSVAAGAFSSCAGLTGITIPATVADLGYGTPFYNCNALQAITVETGCPNYASIDGVLFDAAITELLQYPGGRQGAYVIPAGITSVAPGAFDGCTGLTSLSLPASVATIGDEYQAPFYGCPALVSIEVDLANPDFASNDGVLFDAAMTVLIRVPAGKAGTCMIPSSVTTISYGALSDCKELTAITVSPANPAFRDIDGVLFDASGTTLLQYPGGRAGPYTVPAEVTEISHEAFYGCTHLTRITIPAGVRSLSPADAFSDCTGLTSVVFLGNAPGDLFLGMPYFPGLPFWLYFSPSPASFTIYYLQGSSGFTSPTWRGLPAVEIQTSAYPAASWLLAHDLWYDTDLHQDLNGDGVSLLLAYALALNPNDNLVGRMPRPVLEAAKMTLTFHAASPGITYAVETSVDLQTWVTDGVFLSELAPDHTRTATVDRLSPARFLRLVVSD